MSTQLLIASAGVLVAIAGAILKWGPETRLIDAQRNSEIIEDFALLAGQLRVELDAAHADLKRAEQTMRSMRKEMLQITRRVSKLVRDLNYERKTVHKLEMQIQRLTGGTAAT